MLKHFVFIKYRSGTPDEHIDAFCDRMRALRESIPEIGSLEIDRDEFGEARSWHLLISMTFRSVDTLQSYQSHPAHVAIMQFNDPHVADIGCIDRHDSQLPG